MSSKLKRDQISNEQAQNWRMSFEEEEKLTFSLKTSQIILQKETYKILAGENENRVRIYLGLEKEKVDGKYALCAFAVSSFLLGSGDVYVDYETPVFKLEKENKNFSDNNQTVIDSIRLYRKWRSGELDPEHEFAKFRKYIYPNAYLLTKFELHEIFNVQNKTEAQIELGISKVMNVMIVPEGSNVNKLAVEQEVFNDGQLCPPYCDDRSIYNS